MIDMMDLNVKNKRMLLSNLSFDHPLLLNDINDLINLLTSGIFVGQVYFKDNIDLDSIEKVKLLLEALPNIDDSKIEKYIMKAIDSDEKEKLDNMSFQNIDTWNIAYSIEKNRFSITTLSKYRMISEWFNNAVKEIDEDLSTLEKVAYLYDKVKLFELNTNPKYGRLPEILSSKTANSYGYNLVFKGLLSMCDIKSAILNYQIDGEDNYITIAEINDEKYDVNGIYLFEPSMDTIGKEQYRQGLARRMNYNFFGMKVEKFSKLKGQVITKDLLKILISSDELECKHRANNYSKRYGNSKIKELEDSFKSNLDMIYLNIHNTQGIGIDIMSNIISNRVEHFSKKEDEKELIKETVLANYKDREKDLFSTKNVKQLSRKEPQNH